MIYRSVNLGFSTADAEDVTLAFDRTELHLIFRDWREETVEHTFKDVLAFKWDGELSIDTIRDDTCYEVIDSSWLEEQARLQGENQTRFTHYKLCFNACGVLDVLCIRQTAQ